MVGIKVEDMIEQTEHEAVLLVLSTSVLFDISCFKIETFSGQKGQREQDMQGKQDVFSLSIIPRSF